MLETTELRFVYTEAFYQRHDREVTLDLDALGEVTSGFSAGDVRWSTLELAITRAFELFEDTSRITLELLFISFRLKNRWTVQARIQSPVEDSSEVLTYDTLAGELALDNGDCDMSEIMTSYLMPGLDGLSPDEHDAQTNINESAI
ncbi:hypothetical protein LTR97_010789 [Elasticomyces elasticus]|uniref:Uncharacterized protein n=1 Tax=Elasticomyces elasticus TaxID=574655 RepID=A0AAN7ZR98_9PEZI|nr:hypothetical protein LTR97_010789 [Elasticomyces elasticus]